MPIPIEIILNTLIRNIMNIGSPIKASNMYLHGWAYKYNLPKKHYRILYAGLLYQLTPYIAYITNLIASLEEKPSIFLKLGSFLSRFIDLSSITSKVSKDYLKFSHEVLDSIVRLLKQSDIDFGYLYDDELYSGVLLYDLGLDDLLYEYASRVYNIFKEHNVSEIITIDPHTTYLLREIYPKYIDSFDIEVTNYLELLYNSGFKSEKHDGSNLEVVIQDPCIYARYLKIIDQPRSLLESIGYKIVESSRCREYTRCCGGPIESISPRISHEVSIMRLRELASESNNIVSLCPICYLNLSKNAFNDIKISDIAILLAGG